VEDFVEKLDRIEPPGQMISFLTDPLLQKYVDLKPSLITSTRIDLWLALCLEEQYEGERLGNGDSQYLSEVLNGLLKHAQYIKALHPTVLAFLKEYLLLWNGQDNVDTILELLSYVPIETYDDVFSAFLSPVERALGAHGIPAFTRLFDFYTALVQHQVSIATTQENEGASVGSQAFSDLIEHVTTLSTSVLLSLPNHSSDSLLSSILTFYELLSTSSRPPTVLIHLPPMRLIYLLAQSPSSTTLSRICGVVGSYKSAFDQHPGRVRDFYSTPITDSLNFCLRDIFNLFWKKAALHAEERKSVGLYCDPALRTILQEYLSSVDREYAMGSAFGVSNNAWLASLSATAWRAMEEGEINREGYDRTAIRYHRGPVSERSLDVLRRNGGVNVDWDGLGGYKVFVLRWLEERGLGGIKDVLVVTVPKLKGKI